MEEKGSPFRTDSIAWNAQPLADGSFRFSATVSPQVVPCLTRMLPQIERAHSDYSSCLEDARKPGGIETLLKTHVCTTAFLASSYGAENAAHECLLGPTHVSERYI